MVEIRTEEKIVEKRAYREFADFGYICPGCGLRVKLPILIEEGRPRETKT